MCIRDSFRHSHAQFPECEVLGIEPRGIGADRVGVMGVRSGIGGVVAQIRMRVQERFVPCGMVVFESGDRQVCRQKAELPDKAVGHPVHVGRHDQSAQSHYLGGGLFGTAPQRGVEIPGHLPCDQLQMCIRDRS